MLIKGNLNLHDIFCSSNNLKERKLLEEAMKYINIEDFYSSDVLNITQMGLTYFIECKNIDTFYYLQRQIINKTRDIIDNFKENEEHEEKENKKKNKYNFKKYLVISIMILVFIYINLIQ